MKQMRIIVGRNLRAYRTEKGYTQEQLARLAEVDLFYISKLENGKVNVSVDTLEKLSEALEIEAYTLLMKS